jgi:hypothetical protein
LFVDCIVVACFVVVDLFSSVVLLLLRDNCFAEFILLLIAFLLVAVI